MVELTIKPKATVVAATDVGVVRRQNEDAYYATQELPLYLVADGMGGHRAGEVAAQSAVQFLSEYVKNRSLGSEEPTAYFKEAISAANFHLYQMSLNDSRLQGMGTTLCLLYLQNNQAIVAHVGDSRIYRMQEQKLERLTRDHNLAEELLELGTLTAEAAQHSPLKNVLTRSMGTNRQVEAVIEKISFKGEPLFLLCSDGLTNYVDDLQLQKILSDSGTLQEKSKKLVELAKEQGGGDNITLVLVQL